jgi:hypothetical protein
MHLSHTNGASFSIITFDFIKLFASSVVKGIFLYTPSPETLVCRRGYIRLPNFWQYFVVRSLLFEPMIHLV